ncbi:MAG: gamma-glutamyltransferase [Oscillospiraceae bacterium]|nr:gamma-glutamyltransferase [Oscillospiraceae bacterium]
MKHIRIAALILALVMALTACGAPAASVPSDSPAPQATKEPFVGGETVVTGGRDATGMNGVVSSGREEASQLGVEILQAGGNAIDAAVAMGFLLGVCEQQSSGIGGGGFMMIRFAETGEVVFIDFRDESAAAASLDMWTVDENGKVLNDENKIGGKAVAVPGEVKGMLYALDTYGTMSRAEVMAPAIEMAEEGFVVSEITSRDIKDAYGAIIQFPATEKLYLNEMGFPYEPGEILKNPDLANTLRLIAEQGESVFYEGEIAEKIVAAVQATGGCLTMEDMAEYEIHVGEPVHGTYRGYDIYSSNLPSSGGSIILEILNILENFDVPSMDPESAEYFHLLSETFKLGFADRTKYMGDPAYVDVPVSGITSKDYAAELAATIDMEKSQTYEAGDPWPYESASTTHYSIMDAAGNMVAVTKTVDATFASGLVAEGTGILLNDTLFDFSVDPESPNVVAGNKRPLSSMSPTLVLKDGVPFLALGAPGTTRIITGVAQVISKVIDHGMDVQEAIDAIRMHDDFGTLILEDRVTPEVKEQLAAMGHELETGEVWFTFPCVQATMRLEDGTLRGGADPRRDGKAVAF